jgi:hypothetical protein
MSKTKSVERSERPLAKTVLAKLIQIGEPTRSIYAERLRELKPNAREALQLLSVWEGKRAELALTQPLSANATTRKLLRQRPLLSLARPWTPLSDSRSRNRDRARQNKTESKQLPISKVASYFPTA